MIKYVIKILWNHYFFNLVGTKHLKDGCKNKHVANDFKLSFLSVSFSGKSNKHTEFSNILKFLTICKHWEWRII